MMRTMNARTILPTFLVFTVVLAMGCGDDKPTGTGPRGYDVDVRGIPKFVRVNYIEADRIASISKFRSSIGHDYSDDFEHCRSMKHYFQPNAIFDWSTIRIFSPVNGTVTRIIEEWAGTQVWIQSQEYPDFEFRIFHIKLQDSLKVGQSLSAGQPLGTHIGSQTMSDIAVGVSMPKGWKLVSYFDVMTDSLFQTYQECGVSSRSDFIITKEARDADSLTCNSDTFAESGHLEDWTALSCHYDVDAWGIPKFVRVNYIELDRITRISKFRSSIGHDYSDNFEHCRSMKHYFLPYDATDWSTIRLFSPVNGTVARFFEEWAGTQVWIQSQEYPDFEFRIFHIHLKDSLKVGQSLSAGQLLGTHIGNQTMSDIAVYIVMPTGRKLISYFDVMTDSLFQAYQARGLGSRSDAIITKEARDADPLTCEGETFVSGSGLLEDWVYLN
jgi:hypothetical protein